MDTEVDDSVNFPSDPIRSRRVRIFCPVLGCKCSDPDRARGWGSHAAMRSHLNEHCAGRLQNAIPAQYLEEHRLDQCSFCGQLIHRRFNQCCPRCRPNLRRLHRDQSSPGDDGEDPLDILNEIFFLPGRTFKYVPRGARDLWSQCLARCLAQCSHFNDIRRWMCLLKPCLLHPHVAARAIRSITLFWCAIAVSAG